MKRFLFLQIAFTPLLQAGDVDFNRDIRPILSNRCIACHGPDEGHRKADLRLDTDEGLQADLGGYQALKPGHPEDSEIIARLKNHDPEEIMPPKSKGQPFKQEEIALFEQWIKEGGKTARHWSFAPVVRAEVPAVKDTAWTKNPIDNFVLARLEAEDRKPAADDAPEHLMRRLSLDLNGLPPTPEEADKFALHPTDQALAATVAALLSRPAYGEHMARQWLDIARYADSQGYAEDRPRSIWAWRDWVINAFNRNMPYNKFTIDQLAGDLLPNATEQEVIATAFNRNTQTNTEGGTSDEEYRNVAVVDRVNTTMQTWMGVTMGCAQCHTHKYDPITQTEYFQVFAIFNQTTDNDLPDDAPALQLHTPDQLKEERKLRSQIASLQDALVKPSHEKEAAQAAWEESVRGDRDWDLPQLERAKAEKLTLTTLPDHSVKASGSNPKNTKYRLTLDNVADFSALRLETLADDSLKKKGPGLEGNFVLTHMQAKWIANASPSARFIRVELPGKKRILSLAEVEVMSNGVNVAPPGLASQSSTGFGGDARRAVDGNPNGNFSLEGVTHTQNSDDPWWELDLGANVPVDLVRVWNRVDGGNGVRLAGMRVVVLDADRNPLRTFTSPQAPEPSVTFDTRAEDVAFATARADFSQTDYPADAVLMDDERGWAIAPQQGRDHQIILFTDRPQKAQGRSLELTLTMNSPMEGHNLGRFRVSTSANEGAAMGSLLPAEIRNIFAIPPAKRSASEKSCATAAWRELDASLAPRRAEIEKLKQRLADSKPYTSVPVMRELPPEQKRETHIQMRGSFLDLGPLVHPGVPADLGPIPTDFTPNRLGLANYLVSKNNPLTARVAVNRLWESIFGRGLVRTSEDFGAQGEPPSHPELLDWLASELMDHDWDLQHVLRLIVTSHTYRQSSAVSAKIQAEDPENVLLSRGPSKRLSAEQVRDQALFASGLLTSRVGGPPARPPRPSFGLKTAFTTTSADWVNSEGPERYRRGVYTETRRSMPHPSLVAFDAVNREVCVLKRSRSNTPMQALVTLNDPVYVEAAQALARRALKEPDDSTRLSRAFRLTLIRPPKPAELAVLTRLLQEARQSYAAKPIEAKIYATDPLGPLPKELDPVEAAAWTLVAQAILNLDETIAP